jgi:hypothetical protein
MKKKVFIGAFVLFILFSTSSFAQFNPYADNTKMVSVGVGASGWGIPLFVRYEQAVADNISVGGALSFQSKSEKYATASWNHTIVGVNGRASYHFNELFSVPDEWDFYGGASLGYYFWNTKVDGVGSIAYTGSGSGGFNIGAHVGARYFVNDNLGINLELGGGSVLAGGTIGVTFLF